MKKLLLILLLIVRTLYATVDTTNIENFDTNLSYGFLGEKTPVSLLEISKLVNINNNSEFYTTIGTMLFGSGIAYGYKYYLKDKSSSSLFFNIGQHISFLGTFQDGLIFHGTNIATGFCILQKKGYHTYRETFAGRLKHKPYKKSSLNIGISLVYFHSDKSKGFYPFINWQKVLPK